MGRFAAKFFCVPLLLTGWSAADVALAADVGNNTVDVASIIKKSVAVNNADWKAQILYGHRELDVKAKIDSAGSARGQQSKTFEVMMIEGSPYERLVGIDNESLSPDLDQQERLKLNREIKRRQAESMGDRQARIAKYRTQRAEEQMLMQQMVNAFNFRYLGEEQLDGVTCYRLAATPNPSYTPPVEKARVLTGMEGELWISKQSFHWVRVRAEVTEPVEFGLFVAKVKPGTSFELDQQRVGDFWLPKRFTQSVNASIFGLYGYRAKEETDFSSYHENTLHASADSRGN
jgi:hypothetical protein